MNIELDKNIRNLFLKEALAELLIEVEESFNSKPESLAKYDTYYKERDAILLLLHKFTIGNNYIAEQELNKNIAINDKDILSEEFITNT